MKWALVTGASSGIGFEFAHVLAENSYNVILVARRKERLEQLKAEIEQKHKVQAEVIVADLSIPDEVERTHSSSKRFTDCIDVLINNAGYGALGKFHEMDDQYQLKMIDLSVRALTHLCYLFSRDMVNKKAGHICNVASTAAFQPGPIMSVYFATKAFVLSFSEGLSEELSDHGVVVSALCPGATESEFKVRAHMEDSGLMTRMSLPSSREVAEFGFHSMIKGKVIAIHGFMNRVGVFLNRFSPRFMVRKLVRKLVEIA